MSFLDFKRRRSSFQRACDCDDAYRSVVTSQSALEQASREGRCGGAGGDERGARGEAPGDERAGAHGSGDEEDAAGAART